MLREHRPGKAERPVDDSPQSPGPRTAQNSVHLVLITTTTTKIERLTGLGARPLNEIKIPTVRTGGATFSRRRVRALAPGWNMLRFVLAKGGTTYGWAPPDRFRPVLRHVPVEGVAGADRSGQLADNHPDNVTPTRAG